MKEIKKENYNREKTFSEVLSLKKKLLLSKINSGVFAKDNRQEQKKLKKQIAKIKSNQFKKDKEKK